MVGRIVEEGKSVKVGKVWNLFNHNADGRGCSNSMEEEGILLGLNHDEDGRGPEIVMSRPGINRVSTSPEQPVLDSEE